MTYNQIKHCKVNVGARSNSHTLLSRAFILEDRLFSFGVYGFLHRLKHWRDGHCPKTCFFHKNPFTQFVCYRFYVRSSLPRNSPDVPAIFKLCKRSCRPVCRRVPANQKQTALRNNEKWTILECQYGEIIDDSQNLRLLGLIIRNKMNIW